MCGSCSSQVSGHCRRLTEKRSSKPPRIIPGERWRQGIRRGRGSGPVVSHAWGRGETLSRFSPQTTFPRQRTLPCLSRPHTQLNKYPQSEYKRLTCFEAARSSGDRREKVRGQLVRALLSATHQPSGRLPRRAKGAPFLARVSFVDDVCCFSFPAGGL